jgi:glutathione S-transferase
MSKLRLISFDLCPFVQRSTITLEEKAVPYDIEYIDLADKPDWFLEISPLGKVPVLEVDGVVLFESAVICEYIDETQGAPLHPADPLEKARDRSWIEATSTLGGSAYMMMISDDEEATREHAAKAHATLERLESQIDGPLWRGDEMCIVDAAAAPMLQRLWWTDEIVDMGLFKDLPACTKWATALIDRPSVKKSTVANIKARFHAYVSGDRSLASQTEPSWLGRQLK